MTPTTDADHALSERAATQQQQDTLDLARICLPGGGIGSTDVLLKRMYPTVIARGRGPRVESMDGRSYIDFVMGGSALILGHAPAPLTAAMLGQVPKGTHYYQILHEPAVRMADLLLKATGWAEQLIFTSTGSDAVNQALRIARAVTGREGVAKFAGAYHGTGDVALVGMSSAAGANHGLADAAGVPAGAARAAHALPIGDLAAVRHLFQTRADDIACLLVDPLQRWLKPVSGFLAGLRALCDEFGVLLVFDEVVTGFRLAYGGAAAHFGVTPDIAAYGKIIGGGLPLGAVVASRAIMERADPSVSSGDALVATSGTFNANVLSCVAGIATLECLAQPGVYDGLAARGAALRGDMTEIFRRHGIPAVVGGEASFWHVTFAEREPTTYEEVLQSDRDRQRRLDTELLHRGIFVMPNGRRSISTAHGQAEIDAFLSVLNDICKDGKC